MPIQVSDMTIEADDGRVVEYIRNNHYSGTCNPISNRWMITTDDDEIVGGIVFANPMSEQVREFIAGEERKHQVTELHRLYTNDACGKNVESWFIANALDKLKEKKPKYRFVVSYADSTEGHSGVVYQATNALYTGTADERKFYETPDGELKAPRQGGENVTLADAEENGWDVVERGAKNRYVFPLPDQYEARNDVIADLQCDTYEYPNS